MIYFTILCGGSGSRLWPKSRETLPKQLLSFTNKYTMFQNTVLRITEYISNACKVSTILIVCNQEHAHLIEQQIKELNITISYKIISEPKGRDSAAAICIATLYSMSYGAKYNFILPCDHIFDDFVFAEICKEAIGYIHHSIVTFGIRPTYPETGYGYIQTNLKQDTLAFIEKPDLEKAILFVQEESYLWNAGIFAFYNPHMIHCFELYAADILDMCQQTLKHSIENKNHLQLSKEWFLSCRSISIDYAIMEPFCKDSTMFIGKKTIYYPSYWNDIGSFSALYDQCLKDKNQNVLKGDIYLSNSSNCYIETNDYSFVSVIGINNIVVVQTEDALLICHKDQTQSVKQVVTYLKEHERKEAIVHRKVFRPWGWYHNIQERENNGFKINHIVVYPGERLSLQSHAKKSKHWVIVKGTGKVQVDNVIWTVQINEAIYIPIGALHRIENIGPEQFEFTETQIGDYLGEEDTIYYEDDVDHTELTKKYVS